MVVGSPSATAVLTGQRPGELAGWFLSTAGDTNGDGYDDLIVGASYAHDPDAEKHGDEDEFGEGGAYVILGPIEQDLWLGDADSILWGNADNDVAGRWVGGGGDFDGDGLDDIIVGAMHVETSPDQVDAGAAYVILGPVPEEMDLDEADVVLLGADGVDHSGSALAVAGDLNGDGLDDMIVGSHLRNDGYHTGEAWLFHGPFGDALGGPPTYMDELAVGAIKAEAEQDYLGYAVIGAGDLTGDGRDDIVTGAPFHQANDGAAYVVPGITETASVRDVAAAKLSGPEGRGAIAGVAIAPAGDVDGDGHRDLIVGAMELDEAGPDRGAAFVVLGPFDGDRELEASHAVIYGSNDNDKLGFRVGGDFDLNLDGFGDVIAGAPFASHRADYAGAAYVFLGPLEGQIDADEHAAVRVQGGTEHSYMSTGVPIGDIDGDGLIDLGFAAYGAADSAGEVLVITGSRL